MINMEDLQQILERAISNTESHQGLEISKFYLTDDTLKDVIKLDLTPGGELAVFLNLQRGMCIPNTLPTSANQVSEWQRMETHYRETKHTRTFAYASKGHKKEPQKTADTYDMLRKNITTYTMFLVAMFG